MTPRDRRLAWITGIVAVVVVAVGVAAFVRSGSDDAPTTDSPSTTSAPGSTVAGSTAALTGLPVTTYDPRPALGVKIDEAPGITAFEGLERADLIYEEQVEGGITRCLAVFQSQDAPNVGPVRSLRTSDFDLAENLGHPIIAFSGADKLTLKASKSAPFVPYTPDSSGASKVFHRDRSRKPPHNLFLSTAGVRDNATGAGEVQAPFTHSPPGSPPLAGLPVDGVRIRFTDAVDVAFTWDDARHEWLRWVNRKAHVDGTDTQLGVDSVLILDVVYGHPAWDPTEPELVSVGGGTGLLLSDRTVSTVRWERDTAASPFTLRDADGAMVGLPPGRTWVALPQGGATSMMDAAAIAALGTERTDG